MTIPHPLKILITGGARGIGRGLFRHFLQAGHSVHILDTNVSELEHVTTLAPQWSSSNSFSTTVCDLSSRENIKRVVNKLEGTLEGKLDVLINNAMATGFLTKGMEDEGEEGERDWDDKIAVGLTAPFLLSRALVPLLKGDGDENRKPGCIINISSTRAYQAEPNHEAYSTVKAGILGLTQSMAVSLGARHRIRVNAILPGWIHVEHENSGADAEQKKWEEGLSKEDMEWHPVGRVGNVQDIAKAVEYLIGNEFVTGQEIVVDGGVGRKMIYPE